MYYLHIEITSVIFLHVHMLLSIMLCADISMDEIHDTAFKVP